MYMINFKGRSGKQNRGNRQKKDVRKEKAVHKGDAREGR